MNDDSSIFIRPEHRPDLRAALGPDLDSTGLASAVAPVLYEPRYSSCKEGDKKEDKKQKEVAKDDKGAGSQGPVTDGLARSLEGSVTEAQLSDCVHATVLA